MAQLAHVHPRLLLAWCLITLLMASGCKKVGSSSTNQSDGSEVAALDSTALAVGASAIMSPVDSASASAEQPNPEAEESNQTATPAETNPDAIDIASILGQADSTGTTVDSLAWRVAAIALAKAVLNGGSAVAPVEQTEPEATTVVETVEKAGDVADFYKDVIWKALIAVILLLFTVYVIRGFSVLFERMAERDANRRLFYKKLFPFIRISLWTLAIYVIIRVIFQVSGTQLVAATTAAGVALAFAGQDILKNIFGGLVIILDQPFQTGDKIEVAGTYGEVVSIGLRSTRIVTPDDSLVSVPNAQVVAAQVSNSNAGVLDCQVVTNLYLPGWVDIRKAKEIAYQAASSSKYVYLNKPIAIIVLDEFDETFVTHLKVKAYVLDARYEFLFMSDVTERSREGFRKAGLLPTMDHRQPLVIAGGGEPPEPRTESEPDTSVNGHD